MEIIGDENQKPRVKVIVGKTERGFKGMKKPMMSMTIVDVTVKDMYDKIKEMIKNEK